MELENLDVNVPAPLPDVETAEAFAVRNGISLGVVQGWVRKGILPTVRIGKRRMVNLVSFRDWLAQQDWS